MADVILYLVNRKSFSSIIDFTVSEIIDQIENKQFSIKRPEMIYDFYNKVKSILVPELDKKSKETAEEYV